MLRLQLPAAAQARALHVSSSLHPTAALVRLQWQGTRALMAQQAVQAATAPRCSDVAAEAETDEQHLLSLLRAPDGHMHSKSAAGRSLERKERLSGNRKAGCEQKWLDKLWLLRQFVAEHGRLPPQSLGTLGTWAQSQRRAYKNGKLSEERQLLLESIACWSWDPHEDQWRQMYEQLQDYVAEHGRLPPQSLGTLRKWVDKQRQVSKDGRLLEERQQLLEAIACWSWNLHEDQWQQKYGQLQDYVAEHGRLPPQSSGRLGVWINTQRQARKDGTLSEERQRLLEKIACWSWEPQQDWWQQEYERLQDFVAKHGRLPARKEVDDLWKWCSKQRAAYWDLQLQREHPSGKVFISPERIRLLEAVPSWRWRLR